MSLLIRNIENDDAAPIIELMKKTSGIDHHTHYTLWQMNYFDNDLCLVAYDDQKLAGYIFARYAKPNTAFLWQVVIHADYKGRGLGTNIVEAFIKSVKKIGLTNVITTIQSENILSYRAIFRAAINQLGDMREIGQTGQFGGNMKSEGIYEITFQNI